MNRWLKRTAARYFFIECGALDQNEPTEQGVCESIQQYAHWMGAEVTFLSTSMPIKFFINGFKYLATKGGSNGNPFILCVREQ